MPVEGRNFQYIGEIPLLLGMSNYLLFGSEDFNCATASDREACSPFLLFAHNPCFLAFSAPTACHLLRIALPETIPSVSNKTRHNDKKQPTTTHKKPHPTKKEGKAVKGVPQRAVALLLICYQPADCQFCNTVLRV